MIDYEEDYERAHCIHCERLRKHNAKRLCESHREKENFEISAKVIRKLVRKAKEAQERTANNRGEEPCSKILQPNKKSSES